MKIIILGAGQVGRTVAEVLAIENNDVTVVDRDQAVLRDLQKRLDLRTVHGHASYPSVLVRAGADDAELILAVTNDDEVNMVACQVAYALYQTPTRLARVRSADYLQNSRLFGNHAIPVTHLINPEQMVTHSMQRLIEHPGAQEVIDFADGRVRLACVRLPASSSMLGKGVSALRECFGCAPAQVVAVYRDQALLPSESPITFQRGDEVCFFAAERNVQPVMSQFQGEPEEQRRVMIAGGGNLGLRLARQLEATRQVKIIERDPERCRYLAATLTRAIVLLGEATDTALLQREGIDMTDVFCATTNEDRTNVVSGMLAKTLGAGRTLAIVNAATQGLLTDRGLLDVVLTPAEATIGALLTHIRRGDVVAVRSLRSGSAEALEVYARGDASTSRAVGRSVGAIGLPESARVGAILRQNQLILPTAETVIESDDRVMLMLCDKKQVAGVESAFRVSGVFV